MECRLDFILNEIERLDIFRRHLGTVELAPRRYPILCPQCVNDGFVAL